jgi:hypothetical protein
MDHASQGERASRDSWLIASVAAICRPFQSEEVSRSVSATSACEVLPVPGIVKDLLKPEVDAEGSAHGVGAHPRIADFDRAVNELPDKRA